MNLAQVFLEAFRAMAMNRLRAGLTMLGIIIGVATMVLMPAIGESVRDPATVAEAAQGVATAPTRLPGAIGSISLLVGGAVS